MQVRASCPARGANLGDWLHLGHLFAVLHKRFGYMRVNGKVAAVMRDNHGIAVTAAPAAFHNVSRSVSRCIYRAAVIRRDINSVVRAAFPLVIAEIAGDCRVVRQREHKARSDAVICIIVQRFKIFGYRYYIFGVTVNAFRSKPVRNGCINKREVTARHTLLQLLALRQTAKLNFLHMKIRCKVYVGGALADIDIIVRTLYARAPESKRLIFRL